MRTLIFIKKMNYISLTNYVKYNIINMLPKVYINNKKGKQLMKGLVRNGQKVSGLRFVGSHVIIMEESIDSNKNSSSIFICDGQHIDVRNKKVVWHDPGMSWKHFSKDFSGKRVFYVYMRKGYKGLAQAAEETSKYINQEMSGKNITLIGHSKGALMLRETITLIEDKFISPTFLEVSPANGGTIMSVKKVFRQHPKKLKMVMNVIQGLICSEHAGDLEIAIGAEYLNTLKSLPKGVRYYPIISTLGSVWKSQGIVEFVLKLLDWACFSNEPSDGIITKASQESRPKGDKPHKVYYITASHASSLKAAIKTVCKELEI